MSVTGGVTQLSELHLTTDLADAYIASAATWNAKFNLPSLTSGSVLFSNGTTIAQDNANLFWDDTNNRLGIGTAVPLVSTDIRTSGNSAITPLATVPDSATTLLIGNTGTNGVLALGQNNTGQSWLQGRSRLGNGSSFPILLNPLGGNVLINTTTDAGFRLDVNGSVRATGSISAAAGVARGLFVSNTLVATANNDDLVGLDIQNTYTTGSFTGVKQFSIRASLTIRAPFFDSSTSLRFSSGGSNPIHFYLNSTSQEIARFFGTTGNLVIQNGGTFTDIASARLAVNSTTQGFLPPRMTSAQRTAIASPATGLIVYQTDGVEGLYVKKAAAWAMISLI
jgi:hypothetical protein